MKYVIKGKDKNTGEVIECAEFRNKVPAQFFFKKLDKDFGAVYDFWVETQPGERRTRQMLKNDILRILPKEELAIIELHEKLNELNIEHEFIDRKEESIRIETDKKMSDIIDNIIPFNYQITVEENGNKISLIQSRGSYRVTENMIEVYNFHHYPIVLTCNAVVDLICNKKLNERIIKINEKL